MDSSSYHGLDGATQKEIEDKLVDVGERLFRARSTVETDALLTLLSRAEVIMANMYQEPPTSTIDALIPLKKALISHELFRHADVNIQVAVASCLNEITRICAPSEPYDEDQMKDVFQLFMVALKHLSSESVTINFIRGERVLAALAIIRTCMIMLDLQLDAMVVKMFQLFFDTIRPDHASAILKNMETTMTLVIEESEEISPELLMSLLASVEMDNKNVSPTSWELGKTVFENCATKLQPYLREAVNQLNLDVSDYAEIVASLCQDTSNGNMVAEEVVEADVSDDVVSKLEGSSEFEQQDLTLQLKDGNADKVTEEVVAAGVSGDGVSNLDGCSEDDQEDCTPQLKDGNGNMLDDENSSQISKSSHQIAQLKSNCAESDTEVVNNAEIVQSETDTVVHRRRRDWKPNFLMRPEEGYERSWMIGGKCSRKVSCDSDNKEKKDLVSPLELGNTNRPSNSSPREFGSVSDGNIGKRGRSKNKESMTNQDSDDQELPSKRKRKNPQSKVKTRGSNTPKKTTERDIIGSSTVSIENGEGKHSGTDSEEKDELVEALGGRKENRNEILSEQHESRDADKMVESPNYKPEKGKYPGNLALEIEEMSTGTRVDYGEDMVNLRISVWWPMDKTFYTGTVESFDPLSKKHKIIYDDDEEEVLDLKEERWELFSEKRRPQMQSSQKEEADHPSPAEELVKTEKKVTKRKAGSSRKQPAPTSSKRSKSDQGHSLVKSGDSATEFVHMNDEPDEPDDDDTPTIIFSVSKDVRSHAGKKVSRTSKKIRKP